MEHSQVNPPFPFPPALPGSRRPYRQRRSGTPRVARLDHDDEPLELLMDQSTSRDALLDPELLSWARTIVERAPTLLGLMRQFPQHKKPQASALMDLAFAYLVSGDLQRGVEYSDHAAALMARLGLISKYEEIYIRVARAYRQREDLDQVLLYLGRALEPPPPLKARPLTVFLLRHSMAEILMHRHDYAGAVPLLEAALQATQQEEAIHVGNQMNTQVMLAMALGKVGRYEDSLGHLRQAQASAQRAKDEETLTQVRYLLVHALRVLRRPAEAVQEQEALLRLARAHRVPRRLLLEYLVQCAVLWGEAGDQRRAHLRWTEALPLVDAHSNPELAAVVRNQVAVSARRNGEPRRSLRLAREAAEQAPVSMRDALRVSQAQAHMDLEEYEDAAHLFAESLALARAQGDERRVSELLLLCGDAQAMLDGAAARRSLGELLERYQDPGLTPQPPGAEAEITLRQRLGLLAALDGDEDEAAEQLDAARRLARAQDCGAALADALRRLLDDPRDPRADPKLLRTADEAVGRLAQRLRVQLSS